jgi:hypothetical protein
MSESYLHLVKSLAKIYDHLETYIRSDDIAREMIEEVKEDFLCSLVHEKLTPEEIKKIAYMIYNLPSFDFKRYYEEGPS